MSIMIIGGTGFIGRRLVPLLAKRGEEIVCMDMNPQTADYSDLGKQVRVTRGDVSQFDDVTAAMTSAKPSRVINLAYFLGSEHPPRVAFKLNILGMDNCFEAARLAGRQPGRLRQFGRGPWRAEIWRPNGRRERFPSRPRAIRDAQDLQRVAGAGLPREARHGDHRDPPGQCHRHGQDRRLGRPCLLHYRSGARQRGIVSYKDAMRCPIHVDEIAEIFARVIMTDKPRHWVYNTGGHRDQPGRACRYRARIPA